MKETAVAKADLSFKDRYLLYAPLSISVLISDAIEFTNPNLNFPGFYEPLKFFLHNEG